MTTDKLITKIIQVKAYMQRDPSANIAYNLLGSNFAFWAKLNQNHFTGESESDEGCYSAKITQDCRSFDVWNNFIEFAAFKRTRATY